MQASGNQQSYIHPGSDLPQEIKIAVMSWCTANGKVIPVIFKYIGEDQMVYTIRDVYVKRFDNHPNGYPYNEYFCEALVAGFTKEFRLRHTPRDNKWVMVI